MSLPKDVFFHHIDEATLKKQINKDVKRPGGGKLLGDIEITEVEERIRGVVLDHNKAQSAYNTNRVKRVEIEQEIARLDVASTELLNKVNETDKALPVALQGHKVRHQPTE